MRCRRDGVHALPEMEILGYLAAGLPDAGHQNIGRPQ
jgi:hypothetical protein